MRGSTSAGVVSGSSRQSTVISQCAGMTFRWCDASIIVGESVNASSGSTSAGSSGWRAAAARVERLLERRGLSEQRLEQTLRLGDELLRRVVRAEGLEVARRLDERVVRDPGHRRVAAPAVDADGERRRHLLGGRAEVDGVATEEEPLAGALVDRVVAAGGIGMLATQPDEPVAVVAADLLVRGRDERRSPAGSNPSRASDANATALAATWSFMSSAPRPQTSPSTRSPDHGSRVPFGGISEDGVRVAEERQRRPVATLDPRDEVRPLGDARVELGLDPVLRQVVAEEVRRLRLVPRRIDRVEPEERLQERGDLVP